MDTTETLTFTIRKLKPLPAALIIGLLVVLLGFTDLLIGTELSFSIFYLIPITLAVYLSGKTLGYLTALVCAGVWILADLTAGLYLSHPGIGVWNTLVRLGYFMFHTYLISHLIEKIQAIRTLSLRDPLTGAANWRYFEDYANGLIRAARRDQIPLGLAYLDLDNFKAVNDRLGHSAGDEVLVTVVKALQEDLRPQDLLARLGGDEFALIFWDLRLEPAQILLQRLQTKVNTTLKARGWEVTMSLGALIFKVLPSTVGPMIQAVDKEMYEVKHSGKNNIKVSEYLA